MAYGIMVRRYMKKDYRKMGKIFASKKNEIVCLRTIREKIEKRKKIEIMTITTGWCHVDSGAGHVLAGHVQFSDSQCFLPFIYHKW